MLINRYIDHTLLKPTAEKKDIITLCEEALHYNFFSVCIQSCHVALASGLLKNTGVTVCAVAGFPLGGSSSYSKLKEAEHALKEGAEEIDTVINLGWLKSGMEQDVVSEIKQLKSMMGHKVLKVIIETCYLTETEKHTACQLVLEGGAEFVKTSTGFGPGGATFEDVALMKSIVHGKAAVKASGGIKDFLSASRYIELGAARLGTSNGIAILKEQNLNNL